MQAAAGRSGQCVKSTRSAHRARFCLSPIRTQSTHGFVRRPTSLALRYRNRTRQRYYRPLAPYRRVMPVSADRAGCSRPATLAEKRGFSTVTGEFRRETRLSAGGRWIRTNGPATEKLPSGAPCGIRARLHPLGEALIRRGTKSSNPASSSGESGKIVGSATLAGRERCLTVPRRFI